MEGHTASVYVVKLRGPCLVSGSSDKTIRIWDINTRRTIRGPLKGHAGSVICLQFDAQPAEDVIISGDTNGTVIVWQFSTGTATKKWHAHDGTVLSLAFDPKFLVTGGKDSMIRLWNRTSISRDALQLLPDYMRNSAAANLAANSDECVPAYTQLATLTKPGLGLANTLGLTGDKIVSGHSGGTMAIWNVQTGQMVRSLNLHSQGITKLVCSGDLIVSGSADRTARVYDMKANAEVACLRGHTAMVRSVCVGQGRWPSWPDIFTGAYDGKIRHWRYTKGSTWECAAIYHFNTGHSTNVPKARVDGELDETDAFRVFSLAVGPAKLIAAGHNPLIEVWDVEE